MVGCGSILSNQKVDVKPLEPYPSLPASCVGAAVAGNRGPGISQLTAPPPYGKSSGCSAPVPVVSRAEQNFLLLKTPYLLVLGLCSNSPLM